MPETRYAEGYAKGKLVKKEPEIWSDRQLAEEALRLEFNEKHQKALQALENWDSLTLEQKDAILKNMVKWALWRDGWLPQVK